MSAGSRCSAHMRARLASPQLRVPLRMPLLLPPAATSLSLIPRPMPIMRPSPPTPFIQPDAFTTAQNEKLLELIEHFCLERLAVRKVTEQQARSALQDRTDRAEQLPTPTTSAHH
jgi:hypothetical protein